MVPQVGEARAGLARLGPESQNGIGDDIVLGTPAPSSENPEHAGKGLSRRLVEGAKRLNAIGIVGDLRCGRVQDVQQPLDLGLEKIVEFDGVLGSRGKPFRAVEKKVSAPGVLAVGSGQSLDLIAQPAEEVIGVTYGYDMATRCATIVLPASPSCPRAAQKSEQRLEGLRVMARCRASSHSPDHSQTTRPCSSSMRSRRASYSDGY